jgi:ATP-dependent helicase HepA
MLKSGMYVRCSIDVEDPSEPRDFISGRIVEVNDFSETAKVKFFDLLGLKKYYQVPETLEFPLSKLHHCRISNGSQAEYSGIGYHVVQCSTDKKDDLYYYYLANDTGAVVKVCEKDIKVTFNAGEISPLHS